MVDARNNGVGIQSHKTVAVNHWTSQEDVWWNLNSLFVDQLSPVG